MAGNSHCTTKQLLGHASAFMLLLAFGQAVAVETCGVPPVTQQGTSNSTIIDKNILDYAAINRVMLLTDDVQRRKQLLDLIGSLAAVPRVENSALLPRLQIALAHTEIRLGKPEQAAVLLKQVSLDSSQAPAALVLLAEATRQSESVEKATSWILNAADLFPQKPDIIEGLLSAAQWQTEPQHALVLLLQAKSLVDTQLNAVSQLLQQSQATGFIESVSLENPDPVLWSLAHETFTDPAFALAHRNQTVSRAFHECLQAHLEKTSTYREENPTLIRDLGMALQQMEILLPAAKTELREIEHVFLDTARQLKQCQQNGKDCNELRLARDREGRVLTSLRNRVQNMEHQRRFLADEKKKLVARWQAEQHNMSVIGMALLQKNTQNHQIMTGLLQQALEKSERQWQQLAGRVYFQLASVQESMIDLHSSQAH